MKKSFPNQDIVSIEDKNDLLNSTSHIIYDNLIIDNNLLRLNTREDPESTYRCIFSNRRSSSDYMLTRGDHCSETIRKNYYKCEVEDCDKIYKSKENLTLHIKNIHLHLKPYRCRFCNSTFSHRNGIF
jgi:hypothetical protein